MKPVVMPQIQSNIMQFRANFAMELHFRAKFPSGLKVVHFHEKTMTKGAGRGMGNKSQLDHATKALMAVRDRRDKPAFVELYRLVGPRLNAYLLKRGLSSEQSEEILQEVFVSVWNKAHLFDECRAPALAWIFRMTRNQMIDQIRKEKFSTPEDLVVLQGADEPDASDALALQSELSHLHDALEALRPEQREMIEKAYLGELSHSEIQSETGLPLGTIKSRIRLGLEKLRHEMKNLRQ